MSPSPQEELRPHNAVLISTLVVVNIIWWMVMIAAIALGATHMDRCPVQPSIPIYLIVLGGASLLSLSLTYSRSFWEDGCALVTTSVCMALLHLFSFGWFIAGTTWVYAIHPPSYSPGEARYCHQTTYQFAFIVTTLVWATMALVLVCCCCFATVTCCTTLFARRRLIPNRYSFYGTISDSEEPTAGDV